MMVVFVYTIYFAMRRVDSDIASRFIESEHGEYLFGSVRLLSRSRINAESNTGT